MARILKTLKGDKRKLLNRNLPELPNSRMNEEFNDTAPSEKAPDIPRPSVKTIFPKSKKTTVERSSFSDDDDNDEQMPILVATTTTTTTSAIQYSQINATKNTGKTVFPQSPAPVMPWKVKKLPTVKTNQNNYLNIDQAIIKEVENNEEYLNLNESFNMQKPKKTAIVSPMPSINPENISNPSCNTSNKNFTPESNKYSKKYVENPTSMSVRDLRKKLTNLEIINTNVNSPPQAPIKKPKFGANLIESASENDASSAFADKLKNNLKGPQQFIAKNSPVVLVKKNVPVYTPVSSSFNSQNKLIVTPNSIIHNSQSNNSECKYLKLIPESDDREEYYDSSIISNNKKPDQEMKPRTIKEQKPTRCLSYGVHSWNCQNCIALNGYEYLKCVNCHRERDDAWRCDTCDRPYINSYTSCVECLTWRCSRCSTQNAKFANVCKKCKTKNDS